MSLLALALCLFHGLPPDQERDALVGWYELDSGRHALVTFGATGGLRLFDFETPSFDTLVPGEDGYVWRRQGGSEARIEFERDGERVVGFGWSTDAGEEGFARRDDAHGYAQAEVRFESGAVELCGLLMLPRGPARSSGAVVIQGSGDSDRDNVWAFSIANHLALGGIAVLLPDKRGCGQSKGDWKAVGFEELAGDALAGLGVLAERAEVDARRIGLVGLSQGGWIAPLAARRDERVAFAVSVSGAAVTVGEQVLHELEQTVGEGGGPEAVALARELMQMAFEFGRTGAGWEDYLASVEAAPPALAGAFPRARDDWRWAWYGRLVDFDPLPLWKELAIPSLVVYGAEDEHDNVPVAESMRRLDSLERAGLECRVYPGSGHALDDPSGKWIRRDFLDELARWISAVKPH